MGLLSYASNNELLNVAEIALGFATTFVAELLREKMFGGISDVSDLCFLALASHLACSTKQ